MLYSGTARSVIEVAPVSSEAAIGNGLLFPHSEAAGLIPRRFALLFL
jgi:hypothetical protein